MQMPLPLSTRRLDIFLGAFFVVTLVEVAR
jgi:hypothetical protein